MYLILGSACDDEPYRLAHRWTAVGRDVAVATPADLSAPGWRLRLGRPADIQAVAGERAIAATELDAVVSLLPWIGPADLPHVVDDDRDYVAQEMSAFLLAWLHHLPCPVIDAPSTVSLAGCGWSCHQWAAVAQGIGMAADPQWSGEFSTVTVIGGRAAGPVSPCLAAAAEAVAAAAGRALVTLRFARQQLSGVDEPVLTGAAVRPEVGAQDAADALLAWLEAA